MYSYDQFDAAMLKDRNDQFRRQVERRLAGDITEDEFKPLRLMNGVYLQLHAYMLRIAVPYGQLNSEQLKTLAHIADKYDRGYGHFTTRQNIQFNWVSLVDIPDVLDELAKVEMHAIQTSGNCIRNVTSDQFAGAAADEVEDPRPWCELLRQWSTFHPEFSYLPRKFKIAVSASASDRAAIRVHDIGIQLKKSDTGEVGFEVLVGGGQGRTPHVAQTIRDFVLRKDLLAYLEAIMRVYNRYGRRDNKYKARIKILVNELGLDAFKAEVESEWEGIRQDAVDVEIPEEEFERISSFFKSPAQPVDNVVSVETLLNESDDEDFNRWLRRNVHAHKQAGYSSVTISLKPIGGIPGDASSDQMNAVAGLARQYAFDDIRVTHEQNLVLPHVRTSDLHAIWMALREHKLDTGNHGLISDIIACPGLDYCNLANARAIPVAQNIAMKYADLAVEEDIGELKIKISGCINACGHHHVGHIGILGVDRKGEEYYQISLGGRADEKASIGKIVGKGLKSEQIPDAIDTLINTYRNVRSDKSDRFIDVVERVGIEPFQEALYAD